MKPQNQNELSVKLQLVALSLPSFYQLTITIKRPDQRKESKYKDILITKLTIDSER